MKLQDQEAFLRDLLDGQAMEALRQDSLRLGLAAVRRKRRRWLWARSAVLAGIPLLAGVSFFASRFHQAHSTISREPAPVVSFAPAADRPVKVINDEELFALFPNRPIALVGKPGRQQLLFLDRAQNGLADLSRDSAGL